MVVLLHKRIPLLLLAALNIRVLLIDFLEMFIIENVHRGSCVNYYWDRHVCNLDRCLWCFR